MEGRRESISLNLFYLPVFILPSSPACLVLLQVKVLLPVYAHFVVVVLNLVITNSTPAHLVWLPRDKWYRRWKIFETHRFTEVLNLHYDPDLENNNPIFTQDTPAYADVPSN